MLTPKSAICFHHTLDAPFLKTKIGVKILSMKIIITLLSYLLFMSCATSKIAVKKDQLAAIKNIATLPFTTENSIPDSIAREASEIFAPALSDSGFNLVERQAIDKILKEKSLSLAGITSDQSMEIGQLLSAQALLLGNVTMN